MSPLVTIGVLTKNRDLTVARTLRSVLNQSVRDFEVIVVDNASEDNTIRVVRQFRDKRISLIVHSKDQGIARSRQQVLEEARGRFLVWIDSDDFCKSTLLERQVSRFESNPVLQLVGTWFWQEVDSPSRQQVRTPYLIRSFPWRDAEIRPVQVFWNCFSASGTMIRREGAIANSISFDTKCFLAEDYQFWNDLLLVGEGALVPQPLMVYGAGGVSRSPLAGLSQTHSVEQIRKLALYHYGLHAEDEEYIKLLTGEAAIVGFDVIREAGLDDFLNRFISFFAARGSAYDRGARAFIAFLLLRLLRRNSYARTKEASSFRRLVLRRCKPESLSLFLASYLAAWGTRRAYAALHGPQFKAAASARG